MLYTALLKRVQAKISNTTFWQSTQHNYRGGLDHEVWWSLKQKSDKVKKWLRDQVYSVELSRDLVEAKALNRRKYVDWYNKDELQRELDEYILTEAYKQLIEQNKYLKNKFDL